MSFVVGDTVRLKSGGPLMTVKFSDGGNDVECVWFDSAQAHSSQWFIASMLEKDDDIY